MITKAEVRRRLIGAIRKHVAKSGRLHVDRKFLENFHGLTGLPPEHIFYAWRTLRRIDGLSCRWRGRGNGVNFYVERSRAGKISHPENAAVISPLRGKDQKTGPGEPAGFPDESSGPLRGQPGEGRVETAPASVHRGSDPPGRLAGGVPPPAGEWLSKPGDFGRFSGEIPLQVCNRWISARKIRAKACWLSFTVFLHLHTSRPRVKFGAIYARNFAVAALRAGFGDVEICAAYQVGLDEAQASAVKDVSKAEDRDYFKAREEQRAGSLGYREPSQVIARAWLRLRSDTRSDEERWADFFAGKPGKLPRQSSAVLHTTASARTGASSSSSAQNAAAGRWRTLGPGLRIRLTDAEIAENARRGEPGPLEQMKRAAKKQSDTSPAVEKLQRRDHATFEAHLKARGMTVADLLKLSRAEQQAFVRGALAAQRSSENKG